jgi:hypothetical protein
MTSENPIDKNEPGTYANLESLQQSAHSKVEVPPTPPRHVLPRTSTQDYQPDRRKDNTPLWKKCVEIAAIIIALLLLIVTALYVEYAKAQRDEMITQNKISRLNSRLQSRPYVGIIGLDPQVLGGKGALLSKVHNYGVSPARGVYAYGVFKDKADENWRVLTCGGQNKTMNIDIAGPAIFQGTDEPIEILIESTSITSPIRPYLAVCLTFMDMQGAFHFFDDATQGPPCSPYSIKHLYSVVPNDGVLAFKKIYTSVEGAAPQLEPKQACYGEERQQYTTH